MLSIRTSPNVASYSLFNNWTIVDFPLPVFPTIASVCPGSTEKETPFRASMPLSG